MVAVGQQVLPALLGDADGVGEDAQRERLGESGDGVELGPAASTSSTRASASARQPVAQPRSARGPRIFCSTARGVVLRRVGLEQQARRPPRLLVPEVGQPDAGGGLEAPASRRSAAWTCS